MDTQKKKAIQAIVEASITSFAEGLYARYYNEVDDPEGVINAKKNNCFMAVLGKEFMFYSAFVRSYDSSFGNLLEGMGNTIAKYTYEVRSGISSFLLPEQIAHIGETLNTYYTHSQYPAVSHYANFVSHYSQNSEKIEETHETDHYFYNPEKNEHYLIELKASGDLDNKKSRSEKNALLEEYFLLKNQLRDDPTAKVFIYFGTAYNKYGEGQYWKQERVRQFFAPEELLIGRDYWNFVCGDTEGFDVIMEEYTRSAEKIREALLKIKGLYFQ